jgi:hypothetical protein
MDNAVVGSVSKFRDALNTVRKYVENDLWSCSGGQVVELLRDWHQVRAQVESVELCLVREVMERGVPAEIGAVDARSYLIGALTMSPAEAATTVRLAEAFGSKLADTGLALAEGLICRDRAKAILDVVAGLPNVVSSEQQVEVEEILLEHAGELNAAQIRKLSKVLEHYLDPDGVAPREETAKAKRGAFVRVNGDGTQTLRWVETDENIALLQAALEPLSAPRPAEDGTKDTRCPALRRADGLLDLVSVALRHGELPVSRGARPHLIVTITDQALRSDRGLGITASGEHLSNAAVKRISCDAELTAIRLDTNGVPLSMGRTRRTVSPQQWLALVARDKGCVFPDCTRPPGWTQAHHLKHWIQHGPTDLENLALLCGHHHDTIHHQDWEIVMAADGRPELIPPPWIDSQRKPRRNKHWEVQTALHLR